VLLNYQSGDYVERLVESLSRQTCPDWELIVVDNGSADESLERIRHGLTEWAIEAREWVYLPENRHFAAGMNAGIERAQGRVVVALNSDVYLDPGYIDVLCRAWDEHADERVCAFVGTQYAWVWPADRLSERVQSRGAGLLRRIGMGSWTPSLGAHKLLGPPGCAPAFTRQALEAVRYANGDYYDARFVAFGEDVDLLLRMRTAGFRAVPLPGLRYWHIGSASYSAGERSFAAKSPEVMARTFANRWRVWRQIPSSSERLLNLAPILVMNLLRYLQVLVHRGPAVGAQVLRQDVLFWQQIRAEERRWYAASPGDLGLYCGWIKPGL